MSVEVKMCGINSELNFVRIRSSCDYDVFRSGVFRSQRQTIETKAVILRVVAYPEETERRRSLEEQRKSEKFSKDARKKKIFFK